MVINQSHVLQLRNYLKNCLNYQNILRARKISEILFSLARNLTNTGTRLLMLKTLVSENSQL